MQACTFTTEEQGTRDSPIPLGVIGSAIRRGADDPDVTLFQLLYQLDKVCDTRYGYVFQRPGSSLGHCGCQADSATLRNENSVHTRTFRRPQNSSEISRI